MPSDRPENRPNHRLGASNRSRIMTERPGSGGRPGSARPGSGGGISRWRAASLRSGFGSQVPSQKRSAPGIGFGSANRDGCAKVWRATLLPGQTLSETRLKNIRTVGLTSVCLDL